MEHLEGVINKPGGDVPTRACRSIISKCMIMAGNNLLDGLELSTAITHVHKEVGRAEAGGQHLGGALW